METLSVEAELQVSILFGLVKLSGTSRYLQKTRKSFRSDCVVMKSYKTKHFEQLQLESSDLRICQKQLLKYPTQFTHVVTGIQYGTSKIANMIYTASSEKTNQEGHGMVARLMRTFRRVPTKICTHQPTHGRWRANIYI